MPGEEPMWGGREAVALRHELANALVVFSWCTDLVEDATAREALCQASYRVQRVLWAMRSLEEPGPAETIGPDSSEDFAPPVSLTLPRNPLNLLLACSPKWRELPSGLTAHCQLPDAPAYARVLSMCLQGTEAQVQWDSESMNVCFPSTSAK